VLGAAVAIVLAAEYLRGIVDPVPWFPLQVAVASAALALVWRRRDELRLAPLLAVAFVLQVGWVLVRLHADFQSPEQVYVYAPQGQALLDGDYPPSEYPLAAVLLFALEASLGGARSHLVHAFVMVPFQLVIVASLWSLRTRWSAWFTAFTAFWPVNAWFWEFRFDLAPTALLVVGLALAWRRHWVLAGAALSLGFAVKWTPGLALVPLIAYLVARRETRSALRLASGAAATLAVLYGPFLVWSAGDVLAAYSLQAGRNITDESIWHLLLRLFDLEGRRGQGQPLFESVDPPAWANVASVVVQVATLAGVVWLAARSRTLRGAVVLAALMPVIFLITNRVFSVQWFALMLPAWSLAAAVIADSWRDAVAAGLVAAAATIANALILPVPIEYPYVWELMSAARFGLASGLTVWLIVRAVRAGVGVRPTTTGDALTSSRVVSRAREGGAA